MSQIFHVSYNACQNYNFIHHSVKSKCNDKWKRIITSILLVKSKCLKIIYHLGRTPLSCVKAK
uniref:Uncharacterized protein n=1 Tax=Rhizophora mucronata TaxID=61149 RepID=A0A2P2PPL8_RHIMU